MASKFSVQQEIDMLELEKSKISREKAGVVLNKGLTLYVAFLLVGIIGFANEYIDSFMLNVLVIAGIVVLVISTLPYVIIVHNEERWINRRLQELKK
ncbi:hypothetical protein HYV84_07990 [Candidatus Woesearchaeota archaeon]|nr:hypothetical protein [Candidatus Woesearchaeota archaeon]